jgi:hypothetical protein
LVDLLQTIFQCLGAPIKADIGDDNRLSSKQHATGGVHYTSLGHTSSKTVGGVCMHPLAVPTEASWYQ